MVTKPKHPINRGKPKRTQQHQGAAAGTIHESQRNKREREIHRASPRDVFQDAGEIISGIAENLLCVVEDDIDTAPLLEYGEHDSQHERLAQARVEQIRQPDTLPFLRQRGLHIAYLGVSVVVTADTR